MKVETILTMVLSILVPVITGIISYLAAINKSKSDIESVKIQSRNDIDKIKESADAEIKKVKETAEIENKKIEDRYKHDLEKIKTETDEKIRLMIAEKELENQTKGNDITNQFVTEAITDPKKMAENIGDLGDLMSTLLDFQKNMGELGAQKK